MDKIRLHGVVSKVLFEDPITLKTGVLLENLRVIGGDSARLPNTVVLVGKIEHAAPGMSITGAGALSTRRRGVEFKADEVQCQLPKSPSNIIRYFESGAVPMLGKDFGESIVKAYGEDALMLFSLRPQALAGASTKYTPALISRASDAWKEKRQYQMKAPILDVLKVEYPVRARMVRDMKGVTSARVRENPYIICSYEGSDFKAIDKVVMNSPEQFPGLVHPLNTNRILGAFIVLMRKWEKSGHTAVPAADVVSSLQDLLDISTPGAVVKGPLSSIVRDGYVKIFQSNQQNYVQTLEWYRCEKNIALHLARLASSIPTVELSSKLVIDKSPFKMFTGQRAAVQLCLDSNIAIINGGPGTGKTTTIKSLVASITAQAESQGKIVRILGVAPSGLAAERMTAATGVRATTVHNALNARINEGFGKNSNNQIEVDVLLLDEVGNLDAQTFQALLRATPNGARIYMSGDVDQLASVSPGFILSDLMNSERVPTAHLTEVGRQAKGSLIPIVSEQINTGVVPDLAAHTDDWGFIPGGSAEESWSNLISSYVQLLESGSNPMDIQILCSQRSGVTGTEKMNEAIQDLLSERHVGRRTVTLGNRKYSLGDRVIQTRPLKEEKIMNGAVGEVVAVDFGKVTVQFTGKKVAYSDNDPRGLELAFAKTIHKSQGSEYKYVLCPITHEHEKHFTRQKLFTVNSRAKTAIRFFGDESSFAAAVNNTEGSHRHTGLLRHLENYLPKIKRDTSLIVNDQVSAPGLVEIGR